MMEKEKKTEPSRCPILSGEDLQKQVRHVIDVHDTDVKGDYAGVFMPDRLEKKYKSAPKELTWQWLFPAKS